jgi:hypothetical protein
VGDIDDGVVAQIIDVARPPMSLRKLKLGFPTMIRY